MTKEIEEQIHELYNRLMDKPNKILECFQDFFGEERVDIQGVLSEEDFLTIIDKTSILDLISKTRITSSKYYRNSNSSYRETLLLLLNEEDAGKEVVTSSVILIDYFLPILEEYFMEDNFIGEMYILVYFPEVTVTNEFNKSINITDLYVKVPFMASGRLRGGFLMNRASYTPAQFNSDYLHSHIYSINVPDFKFSVPCTGTGPINSTIATLSTGYDEAMWRLLCLEIDRFVRVESISGVPFVRLETVGESSVSMCNNYTLNFAEIPSIGSIRRSVTPEIPPYREYFIRFLLESNTLKFNYINGRYGLGTSFLDTTILISNKFIEWYNKRPYIRESYPMDTLIHNGVLVRCYIRDNIIFQRSNAKSPAEDYTEYIGKKICIFKGREITLNIIEDQDEVEHTVTLLTTKIISHLVYAILRIVNYKYGREETGDASTGTSKSIKYI